MLRPPYNRQHDPAQERLLRTPFLREWSGRRDELARRAGEIGPQVVAVPEGRGHEYIPFAGQSVGLIGDVQPAAKIVQDPVEEADRILAGLAGSRSTV